MTNEQATRLAYAFANYKQVRIADLDTASECTHAMDMARHLIETQQGVGIELVEEQKLIDLRHRIRKMRNVYESI